MRVAAVDGEAADAAFINEVSARPNKSPVRDEALVAFLQILFTTLCNIYRLIKCQSVSLNVPPLPRCLLIYLLVYGLYLSHLIFYFGVG